MSSPGLDVLAPRGTTPRPPSQRQVSRFTDPLPPDIQRPQSPLRTRRLVSDPLYRGPQPGRGSGTSSTSLHGLGAAMLPDAHLLLPGAVLHGGRYRLHELQDRQEWAQGAYEAFWTGQDAQRPRLQVTIYEVQLPDMNSISVQSKLRAATMTLATVSRHPRVPTLLDAFSEQGRAFFVFEPVEGESMQARMRRTGRAVPEQEVVECCIQVAEILEALAQQTPPVVHGLISPEHIIAKRGGGQYMLTNFSVVLAGGAMQFVNGVDRTHLSPYTSPEFARGVVDPSSDVYSLMATAYHLVTGSAPGAVGSTIPQAQRVSLQVSNQFDAILSKGLNSAASLRYQRPGELLQDLRALRSVSGSLVPGSASSAPAAAERSAVPEQPSWSSQAATTPASANGSSQPISIFPQTPEMEEERALLLPRPEELPPLAEANDFRNAAIWLVLLLVAMVIIIVASGRL